MQLSYYGAVITPLNRVLQRHARKAKSGFQYIRLVTFLTRVFANVFLCESNDVWYFQAHELAERIHEVDLQALDSKTVSEVCH